MRPLIGIPTRTLQPEEIAFHAIATTYTRAVEMAGGAPVLIPLRLGEETLHAIFSRLDGLLLAGGVDVHPKEFGEEVQSYCGEIHPERDVVELQLVRWALASQTPILGICRGIQLLNVAAGGSLYQDIPAQVPGALHHSQRKGDPYNLRVHSIQIDPESILARAINRPEVQVNSLHHQGVKDLAPGLLASGFAPDGLVEVVELPGYHFGIAVQWHPEWLTNQASARRLFQAFVSAASENQR